MSTVSDLKKLRNKVGAESPKGRLLSNLVEQEPWLDDASGDRSWAKHPTQRMPWLMQRQVGALTIIQTVRNTRREPRMSIDSARELLADLGKRIAEEEAAVRQRIDRISGYDYPHADDEIRDEWEQFHLRIAPMLKEREMVLKMIVDVEACKPPAPMIISR